MMDKHARVISFILICFFLHSSLVIAKNIGQYGQVFPVIEEDLRQVIMKRLKHMEQSGELAKHQRIIGQRVAEHIIRPKPLMLTPTKKPKTDQIDPTVMVSHDVWTPDGILIARKGTSLNPFSHIQFSKTLFFFDADDAHQVAWVKKHYRDYEHVKFILTGGDIRNAAELFGRIYFDLNGLITKQLHIKHVPCVVNQNGLYWKIKEIGVDDE